MAYVDPQWVTLASCMTAGCEAVRRWTGLSNSPVARIDSETAAGAFWRVWVRNTRTSREATPWPRLSQREGVSP